MDANECQTPVSDHVRRFWELLANETVRIVVDIHRPESFDGLGHWDAATFSDEVAKALVQAQQRGYEAAKEQAARLMESWMKSNAIEAPIAAHIRAMTEPMKPRERFELGKQPCQNFLRGDADIAALGEGNRRNLHQCPKCEGNRAWCDNCSTDHHDGGWETCQPGAYAYVEPE